jgi:hypothetical protein
MHEMTAEARHEEIQLLAVEFSTMLFEASYLIPSYRDWYKASDQRPAYQTLKRLLQILQWQRGGGGRWVLKSPQHLEQIDPLLATFPDAKVVQTHRDPVRVTASYCTMGAYGLRMNAGAIDPVAVGAAVGSAGAESGEDGFGRLARRFGLSLRDLLSELFAERVGILDAA